MSRVSKAIVCWLAVAMTVAVAPREVSACGGRTTTIAEDPKALGVREVPWRGGITYYEAAQGSVVLPASAVKISSALAEAIARRYLEKTYARYEHLAFEAFTFEHGSFVYMYHADVPGLAASYHVGSMNFVSRHAHIHVDAITGDVYGFGCGAGPGIVDMPFEPSAYPADLAARRLPYLQFDTDFVARGGAAPKVDGIIDRVEWQDAAYREVLVGDVLHMAVRAHTANWVAVLFKDFEHHGMIGDFNDVKLLSAAGVGDYFVGTHPGQRSPEPRRTAGAHT